MVNSDAIIGLINFVGGFLDKLGDFLSTDFGTIALLTTIAAIAMSTVNTKILELSLAKKQQIYNVERQKTELKINKLKADAYIAANKERIINEKNTLLAKER